MSAPSELAGPLGFIHRFVPGDAGSSAPVLLLLHGTGGNENDLLDLGRTLHSSASLLSPRGQILENGMPRFFRRFAEGIFDEEDLIFRTHELAEFVGAAANAYHFDAKKVVAIGYSNGANIAASLLLLRPEILRAAVLLRGMLPLVPAPLPKLAGIAVLLSAGATDPFAPTEKVEGLAALLREAGANVSLKWNPAGHQLTSLEIDGARRWLSAHFGGEPV